MARTRVSQSDSPYKLPVRVATTANGALATAFADGQTVDGITLATDDRILIKNQTDETENGIYVVQAAGAPVRSSDADTPALLNGAVVSVLEGTVNADTAWVETAEIITLGVSDVLFSTFGGYTPGTGITFTGTVISANLSTGIAGGQSVIGGTASGENLTLTSTSNATKGHIYFGDSSGMDYNQTTKALTTTGQLFIPVGSLGSPSIFFSGSPSAGIYSANAGNIDFTANGAGIFRVSNGSGVTAEAGSPFNWSNTGGNPAASKDTGLSRVSAAVVGVGNGTQGDISGALSLATVNVGTAVLPDTNGGADIGSTSLAFQAAYFNDTLFIGTNTAPTGRKISLLANSTSGIYMRIANDNNTGTDESAGIELTNSQGAKYVTINLGDNAGNIDDCVFTLGTNGNTGSGGDYVWNGLVSGSMAERMRLSNSGVLTLGTGLNITAGARIGTATLSGGTITVNSGAVQADSVIMLTGQSLGTIVVGAGYSVSARSVGVSFTILSTDPTDTSVVGWTIINPT